ncbi:Copper metallochaperone, bacterial analog of Cox17 protein [Leucobacter sp. 7(1)]|uniref:copper chaperone PCu(A)C n=1 Tax=Leucobacter sp. 7(1) TaxID=1255613 RepID=UPI00097E9E80|nr:copper chaperone PCu(A)C [Leucobacter sp. 7(1)]SJN10865.1 Copper metallochaperone, bacterial analog of Cox17 protein [Leucobacter sp. 7(1)]
MKNTFSRTIPLTAALGVALLAIAGCAPGGGPNSATGSTVAVQSAAKSVTLTDAWIKSAAAGDMTGAFGVLQNTTASNVTVVAVRSQAAHLIELHETVPNESGQMVMREVEGGFVIPANGRFDLEPGGNHFMLMDLPAALTAGEELVLTLEFADGSTSEITALVKDYTGANENYESGDGDTSEPADEHSEH